VTEEGAFELESVSVPHFYTLVVASSQKGLSVAEKLNSPHWCSVTFDNFSFGTAARIVQQNCIIVRGTRYYMLIRWKCQISYFFSVAIES